MNDDRNQISPVRKVLFLGLIAALMVSTGGCESELFDDEIFPVIETREDCFAEPDTWRCNLEVAELCRNGYWNPWYNCAWNGGTCVEETGDDGEPNGMAGCVDPENEETECPVAADAWLDDTDTEDTETGPYPVETPCALCFAQPTDPDSFTDTEVVPEGASSTTFGCCYVGLVGDEGDGNAYWGNDGLVMQTCANGCCVINDYTETYLYHRCCD